MKKLIKKREKVRHVPEKNVRTKGEKTIKQGFSRAGKPGTRINKKVKKESEKNETSNKPIRLNKLISDAGIASRRKADELIKGGSVKVNDKPVTELGTKVLVTDKITVNGNQLKATKHLTYILLNKPKDCITSVKDEFGRQTVMDIVRIRTRIYPIGRLDRNTTGVLLMTNDGELANRLMHPRYQVERVYNAGLDKALKPEDAKKIASGIELEDGQTEPCELIIHPEEKTKITIILKEGKNREVKRIFEHFGYKVKKLDRKMYAGLSTSGLGRGGYRHLYNKEVQHLRRLVKL
jgi:23S rRNA pseudouridine2605 synthase